jgi:hypothetical protein
MLTRIQENQLRVRELLQLTLALAVVEIAVLFAETTEFCCTAHTLLYSFLIIKNRSKIIHLK